MQEFYDAAYPIVTLPFFGEPVQVQLRELTQAQIYACGGIDISLIETLHDKIRAKKKPTLRDIVGYSEIYHQIAKKALHRPSYDEIMKSIGSNIDVEQVRRDILKLHEQLALLPDGKEADELDMEITRLEISANLLLPDDFLAGVVSYAMGIAKSDIKEVNEEMLYNAAVAAKLGGDNPADHLHGRFTDFMRDDINRRAWIIFHQKAKEMGDGS
jgi:hypothetical protein